MNADQEFVIVVKATVWSNGDISYARQPYNPEVSYVNGDKIHGGRIISGSVVDNTLFNVAYRGLLD